MTEPKKIAILGGGVSSITAAFEITSQENWQDKYDLTIYQMGWRIGGKGASGRNQKQHNRIEEHGIHVWFGFYYNAFKAMRACYDELGRAPDKPLATLEDAFKVHPSTAFAQEFHKQWSIWPITPPTLLFSKQKVGEGFNRRPLMLALADILAWLLASFGQNKTLSKLEQIEELVSEFRNFFKLHDDNDEEKHKKEYDQLIEHLDNVHGKLQESDIEKSSSDIVSLLTHARSLVLDLLYIPARVNKYAERLFMMADMALTTLIGIFEDKLYEVGLDSVNDQNFKDWLAAHGAHEMTYEGALMGSLYGGFFGYKDGDMEQPNVETGTLIRALITAVSCTNEGFVFRMEAGMGDAVFAPYYQVLSDRGVKFKYFHKVEEVVAEQTSDGATISEIKMVQQVPLKDPTKEYYPLFDVKELPCWPSEPLYDQIEPKVAQLLQDNHINLESSWSNWSEIYEQPKISLKAGDDFDQVILGISVAGLAELCPTLCELNPAFDAMTKNISTVATQAVQMWGTKDIRELGCDLFEDRNELPECLGFSAQAMDSWADMSNLVSRESFPANDEPKDIAYLCGVFAPTKAPLPPAPDYPIEQAEMVKADMITMLEKNMKLFWPNAYPNGEFDWSVLYAPADEQGKQRFNSQYWRANIDPSERYVQSTVNTTKYRLKTNESGFDNLLLTGDWIHNGFNMGCVESATISGLKTANAVLGKSQTLEGQLEF